MSGRADGCLNCSALDAKATEVDNAFRRSTELDDISPSVYFADMGSSTLASDHDRRSQCFEVSANGECRIGPCRRGDRTSAKSQTFGFAIKQDIDPDAEAFPSLRTVDDLQLSPLFRLQVERSLPCGPNRQFAQLRIIKSR